MRNGLRVSRGLVCAGRRFHLYAGLLAGLLLGGLGFSASATELRMDGASLTPAGLVAAAAAPVRPVIGEAVWQRVRDANAVLLAAAAQCQKIYGLTTGVGANKDQGELSCENLLGPDGHMTVDATAISSAFNTALLHAHGAGVDAASPPALVRAAMIARLNTALTGGSGMEEAVARQLAARLEHDILPVIPERGSGGEAEGDSFSGIEYVYDLSSAMSFPAMTASTASPVAPVTTFCRAVAAMTTCWVKAATIR